MIIEIISRAGRVLQAHTFSKDRITVGRSYENDLVVQDPYMDAKHLELSYSEGTGEIKAQDLDSLNGTRLEKPTLPLPENSPTILESNQVLVAGKTHLRIINRKQNVADALKISPFEPLFRAVASWWVSIAAITLLFIFSFYDKYTTNPFSENINKELSEVGVAIIFIAVGGIVYSGIWALLARLQNLDGRFLFNANLFLLFNVIGKTLDIGKPFLDFNLDWLLPVALLTPLITFVASANAIALSYSQTLHARLRRALITGSAISFLLIVADLNRILFPPDFSHNPSYNMTLVPPSQQLRSGGTENAFLMKAQKLYGDEKEKNE